MNYLGDFPLAGTVEFGFNTRTAAGVPITLAGVPTLAVYKDAATSAMTLVPVPVLDEALGGIVGLHHVTVSLADPDFVAGDYKVVLSAGTVDGQSVAGTILAHFSILKRNSIGGAAGVLWTHTVTSSVTALAIPDVSVWVTSDAAGAVLVAGPQYTNGSGITTWNLPAATYYFWHQKAGYIFADPDTEAVA